jgi:hypothetical protein
MKIVVTSETVSVRSAGMGSDRGEANAEAAGVFVAVSVIVGRGAGAGWRILTVYAGSSDIDGCWMMGAEFVALFLGVSENLRIEVKILFIVNLCCNSHFLPRRLRNPVMVFCEFFTSWCLA